MKLTLARSLPVLILALGCSSTDGGAQLPGYGNTAGSAGLASAGFATGGGGNTGFAGSAAGGTLNGAGGSGGQAGSFAQAGSGSGGSGGSTSGGGAAGSGGSGGAVPTDGKGLFDANCKLCHGEQGVGSPLAPEIQHPVRDYDTWVVRNGRAQTTYLKPMEKWGTDKISDAQLTLILDYLDQPPQKTTGKDLFLDYCANCHGADAKGGPTMRNILMDVAKIQMMVRSGKNVGQYQMRHDAMPAFSTMRLSDAQVTLIHDYVDSL